MVPSDFVFQDSDIIMSKPNILKPIILMELFSLIWVCNI
jgi:hypothetical protein